MQKQVVACAEAGTICETDMIFNWFERIGADTWGCMLPSEK